MSCNHYNRVGYKRGGNMGASRPKAWAKQKPIGNALLAMAHELGPNEQMPRVRDLCSSFAVSTATLNQVFRSLESRGAIVRKHGSGIFVSPTIHQKTIAVVFGADIFSASFSPFWALLLQAVREQATERKHQPLAYLDIVQAGGGLGGHAQLIEDLENRRIDGMLLLAPAYLVDETRQLSDYGVPLVVFGGRPPERRVTHDVARLLSMGVRELAARGCRRVALLGHAVLAYRPQLENELRKAGAVDARIADWTYETWVDRISGLQEHCARLLAQQMIAGRAESPLPDGVVSSDDTMTRGVITALQEANLHPGRDIQIATIVNKGSPVLEPYASNLIQIEYDPTDSARAALDMLEILMNGRTPPQNPVLIAPVLVARASSP